MTQTHSESKAAPGGEIARVLAELLSQAEGMGLVTPMPLASNPDLGLVKELLDRLFAEGIGKGLIFQAKGLHDMEESALLAYLTAVQDAVEGSPLPSHEWKSLLDTLGLEELAALVGASPSSVQRYAKGLRSTPDVVAGRLHYLALLVGYLKGAYNDVGVRRWFERPRTALKGVAPRDLLHGNWEPEDPGPASVASLARSLLSAGVT